MVLSTVDEDGQPSGRFVLLKAVDESGFVFSRVRRGVTERIVLDELLTHSADARRLAERIKGLVETFSKAAVFRRRDRSQPVRGPLDLVAAQSRLAEGSPATALAVNMHLHGVGILAEFMRERAEPFLKQVVADGALLAGGFSEPQSGGNW